jgi:hypothetical protein
MTLEQAKERLRRASDPRSAIAVDALVVLGCEFVEAIALVLAELEGYQAALGATVPPTVRYVVHGTVVREEPAQPRPQAWPCPTAHDAEWLAAKLTERLTERAS